MFGIGGSASSSSSSSTDTVFNANTYSGLYRNSSMAANGVNTAALEASGSDLYSGGLEAIESLLAPSGFEQGVESYFTDRMNGGGSTLDSQITGLGDDLSKFFSESLMPSIAGEAAGGGQLGGGRQGVAQGMAIDSTASSYASGVAELRAQEIASRDAAANSAAGVSAQNSTNAANVISAIPGMQSVLQNNAMASLAPYSALSSILGGTTVLNDSESKGKSMSFSASASPG